MKKYLNVALKNRISKPNRYDSMRVLQVIPYFAPKRGGDVNVCYNISKYLTKIGHEITIITTDFDYKIIVFKCTYNLGLFLYSPDMEHWLDLNLRDYDLVHLHNYRSYQNILAVKYANLYKIPYVLQAHGSLPRIMGKKLLKQFYDFVWGSNILKSASAVIALNNYEVSQYRHLGISSNKIKIVPNAINLNDFNCFNLTGKFKKKYKISDEENIILYLGRLNKIKGCDLLLKAFSELVTEYDSIRLLFVGPDDGFLDSLKSEVEILGLNDQVIFTGALYGQDKLTAYLDSYVYVLPSIYDTFPMTILESCACGTPVIITDRCGIADVVEGNVGYVVEFNKYQLKEALIKILSNNKIRTQFSKRCRRLVEEEFNEDLCFSKLEKAYEDAIMTDNRILQCIDRVRC